MDVTQLTDARMDVSHDARLDDMLDVMLDVVLDVMLDVMMDVMELGDVKGLEDVRELHSRVQFHPGSRSAAVSSVPPLVLHWLLQRHQLAASSARDNTSQLSAGVSFSWGIRLGESV